MLLKQLMNSLGLLILRLGMGGYMATHGWSKLQLLLAGDYDKFADPIGLGKSLSLILVVSAEFACALLVAIGLFTRLAALPVVIAMGVAAFLVHGGDPWSMEEAAHLYLSKQAPTWGSKEPALLYMIPFLALVFTGAGQFSIDRFLWARRQQTEAT